MFDDYLRQVQEQARGHLRQDAARELRVHFEAAVAEHRAAGLTPEQAEAAALAALGRPEDVAAAFRGQGQSRWRRLADGPWAVLTDAGREWPLIVLAVGAALLATQAAGLVTPSIYEVRQPLPIHVRTDYGTWIRFAKAIERLRLEEGVPVELGPRGPEVVATGDSIEVASVAASGYADQVQAALPPELRVEACYVAEARSSPADVPCSVFVKRLWPAPEPIMYGGGALLGLALGVSLAVSRRRRSKPRTANVRRS